MSFGPPLTSGHDMGIQGNLKTVTMPSLLQWLTQEPLTGTLVLRRARVEKRIILREGRILFTASNHPREYLTNYIRHMDWVRRDHPEVMGILKEYDQNPTLPLGRVLTERGAINREGLARIITTKVQESIIDLFFWTEGGFEFIEEDVTYAGIVDITIDVQWVMMEGARLMDELERYRVVFSSPYITFRLTDRLDRSDPRTDEIAGMIDAAATLGEICEALYPTDYPTYKLLFDWHEKGWIELGPEKEAPAAREAAVPLSVGEVVLCRHCGMATPSSVPYCEMCGSEIVSEEEGIEGTPAADAYHLIKGDLFAGRYEIQEVVGLGEVGTVYAAHDRKHQETVTVTAMPSLPSEDPAVLDRVTAAGRTWRKLRHPNIVRVVDMGKAQGLFYLCLEHVEEARSLGDAAVRKTFGETEASLLGLATAVLDALAEGHAQGIVHGGLKAQNVLVDREGHVRVSEFCMANAFAGLTIAQRADLLGLPLYAAPEVLEGRGEADARSDVYSVGVLLYHVATGELPHVGETPEAIREHRSRIPPPLRQRRPDLPPYLERVIQKALSIDPTARYESAEQMLRDILSGKRRAGFRRQLRWIGVGVGAAVVLAVAVYWAAFRERLPTLKDVGNLLQRADAYFASESYIFPEKENAYDVYRKVLRVDPQNERAIGGIEKIQGLFFERGERALEDGELEAARIWLQKIKIVAPDSKRTGTLETKLGESQNRLEAEAEKAASVRKLLASASEALTQVELDPARTRKAFEDLKSLLRIDPANAEAKKAWGDLMERLRSTAEKQAQARSFLAARENFALLASLNPEDPEIKAREGEVRRFADEEAQRESREREVAALLDAAERYLELGQVLGPPGANALESYRRVLQVDPKSDRALKGLQGIKKSYLARADEAERNGNLYRTREALLAAEQAEVEPAEGAVAGRLASLGQRIAAQEDKQKKQETVESLLARAKRQVEAGDLTAPTGANALETYRDALRVDPGNLVAEAGLNDVQERLVAQGRRALGEKRYAMAKDLFDRAGLVKPGRADVGVLAEEASQAVRVQVEADSRKEAIAKWIAQGKRFLEAKQYFVPTEANAFDAYDQVLKIDPENTEAKARLAEIGKIFGGMAEKSLAGSNYPEARLAYEQVLKAVPGDLQAKEKLGQIQAILERESRVEELLRTGDHLYRTRKYTQPAGGSALSTYREVLQIDPANQEASDRIAAMKGMYVDLARQSKQRGELPDSREYLKKAVLVDPDDQGVKQQIVEIESKISLETEKAMAAVRTPVAASAGTPSAPPGTPEPGTGAGGVAGRETDDLVKRAAEATRQERLIGDDGALKILVKAAGIDPGDPRVRQDLGRARDLVLARAKSQREKGDLGQAVGMLGSASLADPGYEPIRQALDAARAELEERQRKIEKTKLLVAQAAQNLKANDLDEAAKWYREALALTPDDDEARRGLRDVKQAYVKLGEESAEKGETERSREKYGKALALDPADAALDQKVKELDEKIAESKKKGKEKEFRPAFSF